MKANEEPMAVTDATDIGQQGVLGAAAVVAGMMRLRCDLWLGRV